MTTNKQWRKILYEKQPYPDNYTDKNVFLRELKKNINFKEVTFFEAFLGSLSILQEFCNIVTFVVIYFCLLNKWIEPTVVLINTSAIAVLGFIYYLLNFTENIKDKLGHDVRTMLTFIIVGRLFSPVLYTLTDTVSTDTIYTTTFFMMMIHMMFFDYGVGAAMVSNSVSLSTAIFASICLASRLSSAFEAFVLVTAAIKMFVLFPILWTAMKYPVYIVVIYFIIDVYCLIYTSALVTILFLCTVFLISIVCPLLYIHLQKYKETIYGPWDEAVVDDADSVINSFSVCC